jgi:hypothetical protein
MEIPYKEFSSEAEYMDFVEKFASLLDRQMRSFEHQVITESGLQNVTSAMPALISLVNTMGYLRGQDGIFLDIRPSTSQQSTLYAYEDFFEARLSKLIETIMQSELKESYKQRLDGYFVKSRSNLPAPSL